jgi:hypothetical protein
MLDCRCSCFIAGRMGRALSPEAEKSGGRGEGGCGTCDAERSVGPQLPNRMRCFLPLWLVPRRGRTCVESFLLLKLTVNFTKVRFI